MIITEYFMTRKDGVILNRTYSDKGFYIIQNEKGIKYSEAVDVADAPFTYRETDEKIETENENLSEIETKAKAYDIIMGVNE